IDGDDEDDENLQRLVEAFTRAAGAEEEEEEAEEQKEEEKTDYEKDRETTINNLPSGEKAVELVVKHVREHWIGQQEHLKKIVAGLFGVKAVHSAILWWWESLVDLLKTNSEQPPDSKRALAHEKARGEECFVKQKEFSRASAIVTEAINLGVNKRCVNHSLTSFFGALDEVADRTLAQQLAAAHTIQVTYPTHDVELDMHQRRIVYNIGGWLLSTILSRDKRQPSKGSGFLPFVNSHKYASAAESREAHPDFSGLEFLVEERNMEYRGKGLTFPSAEFYLFVRALEVGYRHAMINPALLATYLGDLPAEVKKVVSTACIPVKAAWTRCVRYVEDPFLGKAGRKGCKKDCDLLFDFLVMKWHNCRFFAFKKELTSLRKNLKNRKAEMALPDKLKAGVGLCVGTEKRKKAKEPVVCTLQQVDYQRSLNRDLGSQSWRTLTVANLREMIEDCGGKCKPSMRKPELLLMLRSFAPRAGKDNDPDLAAIRPAVVVPD
ncbi:unnamed protein product, partial [Hapterophycus canaliculatus]